jgi:hypothetical protein
MNNLLRGYTSGWCTRTSSATTRAYARTATRFETAHPRAGAGGSSSWWLEPCFGADADRRLSPSIPEGLGPRNCSWQRQTARSQRRTDDKARPTVVGLGSGRILRNPARSLHRNLYVT